MARLSILAICALAILAIGCGDSNDDDGATSGAAAGATEASDGAMKESGGESMKAEGDAMEDSSGEAMESEGDAMKEEASGGDAAMAANRRPARGKAIKAVSSEYGRVVADGRGEAFYLFDKEKGKRSRCYGACARAWPPVITKGRPRAGNGVKARLLGTTKRRNGKRQVTYRGHPLYYYVDDSPGTILCQNVAEFGGLWLVVKPDGNPVT